MAVKVDTGYTGAHHLVHQLTSNGATIHRTDLYQNAALAVKSSTLHCGSFDLSIMAKTNILERKTNGNTNDLK